MNRRRLGWPAALAALALIVAQPTLSDDDIRVERLTWAGVKVVAGDTTLLVDAVGTDLWNGNAPGGLVPVTADTRRRYALVTHVHNDHFDVDTLKAVLGEKGYVICHESQAAYIASRGLRVIPAREWVPVQRGGFTLTALPAEDGFGDHQVSWLITHGDTQIFHGGDTLWHGSWGIIGKQFPGIDVAFLPINGAVVASEPAVGTPAVMTPSQAADAAKLLGAGTLVPIHYGLNDPPHYVESPDVVGQIKALGPSGDFKVRILEPGQALELKGNP